MFFYYNGNFMQKQKRQTKCFIVFSCIIGLIFLFTASATQDQTNTLFTSSYVINALKDDNISDQKKLDLLKIFAKYNLKIAKKDKDQVLLFLLPLIISNTSSLADDALGLIKIFNISLLKNKINNIRQKLLKGKLNVKNVKMVFYLLYCNGAYTVKLRENLIKVAQKTSSPEFLSILLTFINERPYSVVNLSRNITSDANLDSYRGREELYFNLANNQNKMIQFSDEYSVLSSKLILKNKKFIKFFLENKLNQFNQAITHLSANSNPLTFKNDKKKLDIVFLTLLESPNEKIVSSFFQLLVENEFVAPYYGKRYWNELLKIAKIFNDTTVRVGAIRFFNKITFSKSEKKMITFKKENDTEFLEYIAYKTLIDKHMDVKKRFLGFSYLLGYNCYFKELQMPQDFVDSLFEIIRDKTDIKFIRIHTLLLLFGWRSHRDIINENIKKLERNISNYPDLKETLNTLNNSNNG